MPAELLIRNRSINLNAAGRRIAHQEFNDLCENFANIFDSAVSILSNNDGKRFSERQSYGLFVQALLQSKRRPPEFVLTELPVPRTTSSGTKSAGRLDYLYLMSDQAFAVELKLTSYGIKSANEAVRKIASAWYEENADGNRVGVVGQLKSLDFRTKFLKSITPMKFPLLIVCYQRNHDASASVKVDDDEVKSAHESVFEVLSSLGKNHAPLFDSVYRLGNPMARATKNTEREVTISGLGFFGGAPCFE